MNYLSVCSGIEAATVAWHHLGWKPLAFSEIEPFPSAVLAHHYPHVTNLGNMTQFKEWNLGNESIDVLVGGTPCQSFSVAGLRQGLKDPRGNLMLTYLGIAERFRSQWIVWENVPGVLSSNGGRDFGTFLGSLVELGYGFAYRVLDAQWFGVAQRRRRVFVVGYLGNAGSAAKVLFERESVCRNPAPSREKGKGIAANVADCLRSGGAGGVPSSRGEHLVVGSLDSECGGSKLTHQTVANGHIIGEWQSPNGKDVVGAMRARDYKGIGNDDLTEGRGLAVATAFHPTQTPISSTDISHALGTGNKKGTATAAVAIPISTQNAIGRLNGREDWPLGIFKDGDPCPTMSKSHGHAVCTDISYSTAVRRLTPTECEKLQGFPDGYTAIPWRKKQADQCPDGPRYKALGNSMAVPVMRWIGERIDKVEKGAAP